MLGALIGFLTAVAGGAARASTGSASTRVRLLMAHRRPARRLAAAAAGRGRASPTLDAGAAGKDKAFYEGKLAVASFFARNVLPELSAGRKIVEAADERR